MAQEHENEQGSSRSSQSALASRKVHEDLAHLSREELVAQLLARDRDVREKQAATLDEHTRALRELQISQVELEMQNRELRQTQLELERSRNHFQQLYDLAPVPYLTLDADGLIVSLNKAAALLLGSAEKVLGRPFIALTSLTEPAYFTSLLRRCARHSGSESSDFELRVDGKSVFVEASLVAVTEPSSPTVGFRCALVDRTERRRSELERERLHDVERTLHQRFELLDQVTFAINSALITAERCSFETVASVIIDEAFALLKPRRARLVVAPEFNHGRGLEVSRVQTEASSDADAAVNAHAPLLIGNRRVGELHMTFDARALALHRQPARTLELLAERVALALELARLNDFERRERARLDLLARAHQALSSGDEPQARHEGLQRAVTLAVPEFARCSLLFIRQHDEQWKLVGASHEDARSARLLRKLGKALERGLEAPDVARLLADSPEGRTVDLRSVMVLRRLTRRLELATLLALPLRVADQTLGLVCFGRADGVGTHDTLALRPLRELAATCAAALERTRLLEELRTAVRSRDTLLEIVSHDLRSPLSAIQMTARVLGRPRQDEERRRSASQIELIQRSVARMSHLVEDLLSAGNIDAGQFSIELGAVDPHTTLREALALNEPAIVGNELRSVLECEPDMPAVAGDRQRLLQALTNLISNAAKFTPSGGTLCVGAALLDGHVRFHVSDTGPGIPPDLVSQVFVRYWTGAGKRSGLGLGLYIAERIVKAHGGRIWAESSPGKGASFFFTIPVFAQTEVAREAARAPSSDEGDAQLASS